MINTGTDYLITLIYFQSEIVPVCSTVYEMFDCDFIAAWLWHSWLYLPGPEVDCVCQDQKWNLLEAVALLHVLGNVNDIFFSAHQISTTCYKTRLATFSFHS